MIQDIQYRNVCHPLTLSMLVLTLLHSSVNVEFNNQLIMGLLVITMTSFSFWYWGVWGGSDSKWLILSLPWLPQIAWADWCLLFSAIAMISVILTRFKTTDSLALLVPMNSATIILIVFYQLPSWSHL